MENGPHLRHDSAQSCIIALSRLNAMSQKQSPSGKLTPTFRPPDFLLPQSENTSMRHRLGEPEIFLSWNGEAYGPTTVAEVIAGARASSFEDGTLFWFEGQSDWRPLVEIFEIEPLLRHKQASPAPTSPTPSAYTAADVAEKKPHTSTTGRHRRKHRGHHKRLGEKKPPLKQTTDTFRGLGIIFLLILLAVGLTAGIMILMHTLVRG